MTINIPPFEPGDGQVNRIAPFTQYDGENYLSKLARMERYLGTLYTVLEGAFGDFDERYKDDINALITQVNTAQKMLTDWVESRVSGIEDSVENALDDYDSTIRARLDTHIATVNANVAALTNALELRVIALETSVGEFLAGQADVNDSVVNTLVTGPSQTSATLSAKIGTEIAQLRSEVDDDLAGKAPLNHSHPIPEATTTAAGIYRVATATEVQTAASVSALLRPNHLPLFEAMIRPPRPNAVFIGASNITGWAAPLSTEMGWTSRDFSVSGDQVQDGRFELQLDKAIASAAFANSTVGHVFIAGGGNDARVNATPDAVYAAHVRMLNKAKAAFSGARIITIAGLWNRQAVMPGLVPIARAMETAAFDTKTETMQQAWTWLIGQESETMMGDEIHPSAAGYAIFVNYIRRYLHGGNTLVNYAHPRPGRPATELVRASANYRAMPGSGGGGVIINCIDGIINFQAAVGKSNGTNVAHGELPIWLPLWATKGMHYPRVLDGVLGDTATTRTSIYVHDLEASVPVQVISPPSGAASPILRIPPQSWPIGQ